MINLLNLINMTTFQQLPYDQQLIALALLEEDKLSTQWVMGYYTAETLDLNTFQGKGQFRLDTCIEVTDTHYVWMSNTGTYYRMLKTEARWIQTPYPPIEKDHLV